MAELTFTNEKERIDAINALDAEPPLGVDRDEFHKKLEEEIEKIQKAEIKPGEKPPKTPEEEKVPDKPAEKPQEEPWKIELENERKRNADLVSQLQQTNNRYEPLAEKNKTLEEKIKELQTKYEELEKRPPPAVSKIDEEITNTQKTIEDLQKKKSELEKDDLEGKQELADQILNETSKLSDLRAKKSSDTIKEMNDRYLKLEEDTKNAQKESERKQKLEEKRRKEREENELVNTSVEGFRKNHKEFQNEKTYGQMEKDYQTWVWQLASLDTGKPINEISQQQTEISLHRYLKKIPALLDSVQTRGLKEPAELKQFLTLTDIEMTRRGSELNPQNGKWYQKSDGAGNRITFPDMDAAWDYMKRNNGALAQEMADLQNKTAKDVVKTMGQRTDPLSIEEPQVEGNLGEEMTFEQALKVLNEMDVDRITDAARAAVRTGKPLPGNVELYNRALVKTGASPITGDY